jgi:hypothetical protein
VFIVPKIHFLKKPKQSIENPEIYAKFLKTPKSKNFPPNPKISPEIAKNT